MFEIKFCFLFFLTFLNFMFFVKYKSKTVENLLKKYKLDKKYSFIIYIIIPNLSFIKTLICCFFLNINYM